MNLKYISALALLVAASAPMSARVEHILPKPVKVTELSNVGCPFGCPTRVETTFGKDLAINFITRHGGTLVQDASAPVISVNRVSKIDGAKIQDEAYSINVGENSITINAVKLMGVLRAFQTLDQMAMDSNNKFEAVEIVDYPAFSVRGFMHDIGRSYIAVDELKKELDALAKFKVNVFHWHLTDNQGWRIESKLYPQLTQKSYSRHEGKFYTQEEAREIQKFCLERGITIIPEVDMPGHSESFTRAMGFGMQTDEGVKVLKDVIEELCTEVFTLTPYFHIGTDETAITYPDFVSVMVDKVRSLGKKAVAWNPGAKFTSADQIDFLELWSTRGKAMKGVPSADCRYAYNNHFDAYADIVGLYKSNIYYVPEQTDEVRGSIVGIWTDRVVESDKDIVRQNAFYASILAMAERAWIGGGERYIEEGGTNMPAKGSAEWNEFADWERRFLYHKAHTLDPTDVPYVKQTNVEWRIIDPMPNGGELATVLPPEKGRLQKSYVYEGKSYGSRVVDGAGIYLRHTWGGIVPTLYSDPKENTTAYAYTYVYSPKSQTVGAQIETQNYSRSEMDIAPEQGKWDDRCSQFWVNDKEILPPTWLNTHTERTNEITLKNENFSAVGRTPTMVNLKKGWNKVLIKLPIGSFKPSKCGRLPKWMFTFVFTTPDGLSEVPNLVYSPDKIK